MIKPIETRMHELEALCERHQVERLALFGSALREDFDPESSDLDFSVEFSPMSPEGARCGVLRASERPRRAVREARGSRGDRGGSQPLPAPDHRGGAGNHLCRSVAGKPTCGTLRTSAGLSWSSGKGAVSPIMSRTGCSGGRWSGSFR